MLVRTCLVLLAPAVALAQSAQLRLYPSPPTPTHGASSPISLTAPQANAVLAHHLGVSQYEQFPLSYGDKAWEQALLSGNGLGESTGPKVVILLECGNQGCQELIPDTMTNSRVFSLPSLPLHSWESLVALHLHRLADSLGLESDSASIWGLDKFVEAIKNVAGWSSWVGTELGNAIGWTQIKKDFKAAVEPIRSSFGSLTEAQLLDKSGNTLLSEMENLSNLVDSLASSSAASTDSGPQPNRAEIVAIKISGMREIAEAHSKNTAMYQRAANMLQKTLSATLNTLSSTSNEEASMILLTVPPYSPPLIRKRSAWLTPFSSTSSRYIAKRSTISPLEKRSMGSSAVAAGRVVKRAEHTNVPIVPSSKTCFESEEKLNNLTANCLGRGKGIKGISARRDGSDCWVCLCEKTTEDGKTISWAGEGCEKEDLSSDFVLLFFSGFGLLLVLFFSVILLAGVGSAELPGTLSSVSGAGTGTKRD